MKILSNSERGCRKAPADWFTGDAWMDGIVEPAAPSPPQQAGLPGTPVSRTQALYVTFSPGSRTNWHTHPISQILHVTSGFGWVQLEGEPARRISAGDVVVIGPGENHWHGAEAGHTMVHLAIQENDETGRNVVWGRPVSAEEYAAAVA